MSKRVPMIALAMGLGVATLQGGTAEAGTWVYLKPQGIWSYIGSIQNCALITRVQNPDTHLGRNYCEITVTKVESLCTNPQYHDVTPGEAATKLRYFATEDLNSGDLVGNKSQGEAAVCGTAPSADADCEVNPDPNVCKDEYCVNPNWHIQRVMTAAFQMDCETQTCPSNIQDSDQNCCTKDGVTIINYDENGDPITECNEVASSVNNGWVTKDTNSCVCTLPSGIDITHPPDHHCEASDFQDPYSPLNPNPDCIAWSCFALDANGDVTDNPCEPQ